MNNIWIFHGAGGKFASGVFTEKEIAHEYITTKKLTGVLTKYPINISVYDWAINQSFFKPKKEAHFSSDFIQKFSSASQEHYHYEKGKLDC
jgi:hypothetical protein